jgi:hypothetical protein
MNEYAVAMIVVSAISTIGGATIGLFITSRGVAREWERAAIKHGAAHYNEQTGAFTWNDEREKQ